MEEIPSYNYVYIIIGVICLALVAIFVIVLVRNIKRHKKQNIPVSSKKAEELDKGLNKFSQVINNSIEYYNLYSAPVEYGFL